MKATHRRPTIVPDTPDAPVQLAAIDGTPGVRVVLDWTRAGSAGTPAPCVICRKPAICRSPNGRPCHKLCAEAWTAENQRPTAPQGRAA